MVGFFAVAGVSRGASLAVLQGLQVEPQYLYPGFNQAKKDANVVRRDQVHILSFRHIVI